MKSSLKRLQKFERHILSDKSLGNKSKNARQKKRKIKEILRQELKNYQDDVEETMTDNLDDFIAKSEGGLMEPVFKHQRKRYVNAFQIWTIKK